MKGNRWLRGAVLVFVVVTLAGCGEGAAGGSEDAGTEDAGTEDAGTGDAGPVGSDAGVSGDAGTSGAPSIELLQPSIHWSQYQNPTGSYSSRVFTVRARHTGVLADVEFPPEVSPPSWLTAPRVRRLSSRELEYSFTLTPPDNARGPYVTTVRFTTSHADGSNPAHADLTIRIDVNPLPPVFQGNVSFRSVSTDAAPPPPVILPLDFTGSTAVTWSATLENVNHGLTNWVTLSPVEGAHQLSVSLPKVQRVGQYRSNIVLRFQRAGVSGTIWIPLFYTVTPGQPEPRFVAPMVGYVNEPGTLAIRGVSLDTVALQDIRIGGVSATSFTVVSDKEIRVRHPALGTAGAKAVELVAAGRTYRAEMDYLIKARPTPMAGDFTFPTAFNHLVFDSTRDVIIVSTESTLYRLRLDAAGWSIATQRDIAWDRFDLTPDARHLISSKWDSVTVLDAVTLADVETYSVPFVTPPRHTLPSARLLHMLNNGSALLSTSAPGFVVFDSVNRTFRRTTRHFLSSLTRITQDRSRVVSLASDRFFLLTGYYDSTVDDFIPFNTSTWFYSNRIAYSGDGERLLANNDEVLSKDFVLLGTLSATDDIFNYSLELSPDGKTGYRVEAGNGRIHKYDLAAAAPYPASGRKTFSPPFSFYAAFPLTWVTPDGGIMILAGGLIDGSTRERRLVIVPL